MRDALGSALDGLPAAVDFVAKQEGPEAMLQAVAKAFAQHVRMNWDLDIQFTERQPVTFPYLVTLIETNLPGKHLHHRAAELTDLFRRLFYAKQQVRIERLLWQQQGRLALSVLTFQKDIPPEAFVVVCGTNAQVTAEAQRYHAYAPKALEPTGTVLSLHAETTHFAANAYALTQAELGHIHTLTEYYRTASEKDCHLALAHLMQQTLSGWHHHAPLVEETRSLATLYRTPLGLTEADFPQAVFDDRLHHLLRQLAALGLRIERVADRLTISLRGQSWSCPDLASCMYQMPPLDLPLFMLNTPGRLTGDNILADTEGRAWVTDFADAGPAPVAWNAVALEAAIRFDWVDTADLQALFHMEEVLTVQPWQHFDVQDIEPHALRKALRAIRAIRRLAADLPQAEPQAYHVGMFFQAVSRLAAVDPTLQLTPAELARLGHILLAAVILCAQWVSQTEQRVGAAGTGLRIDRDNRMVWVDNTRLVLRGQSYDLLCYLYMHAGKLCSRRDLVEHALQLPFDDQDESQHRRLNTAMSRLRERLGDDPRQPRYLHTEPGGGYRLTV